MNSVVQETGASTLSRLTNPLYPSAAMQRFRMNATARVLAAVGDRSIRRRETLCPLPIPNGSFLRS